MSAVRGPLPLAAPSPERRRADVRRPEPPAAVRAAARGLAALRAMGAGPTAWMLPAIGVQVALASIVDTPVGLAPWQAVVALALIVVGGALLAGASRELDEHATSPCPDEPARALVVTGPYRIARHPMYLGAVAVLAGAAVALGSPAAGGLAAGYALWIDRRVARAEDASLERTFGGAWRAWAARTRRWI